MMPNSLVVDNLQSVDLKEENYQEYWALKVRSSSSSSSLFHHCGPCIICKQPSLLEAFRASVCVHCGLELLEGQP